MIESIQNPRVKQWKKFLTKKEREKSSQFIVEGFHLVEEALKANAVITLIVGENVELPKLWDVSKVIVEPVTTEIVKELAETETTQSIFAICQQTRHEIDYSKVKSILMVDAVQDPGNIGTMIRTADAAGVEAVVLGNGCADLYNPKTIRSTQGSLFHLPIVKGSLQEIIPSLKEGGCVVIGTTLQNATSYESIEQPSKVALIVGNEGAGVSNDILGSTNQNVFIPIRGKAESLNVAIATGILLYHFVK